jgi:hypothetical protein
METPSMHSCQILEKCNLFLERKEYKRRPGCECHEDSVPVPGHIRQQQIQQSLRQKHDRRLQQRAGKRQLSYNAERSKKVL